MHPVAGLAWFEHVSKAMHTISSPHFRGNLKPLDSRNIMASYVFEFARVIKKPCLTRISMFVLCTNEKNNAGTTILSKDVCGLEKASGSVQRLCIIKVLISLVGF